MSVPNWMSDTQKPHLRCYMNLMAFDSLPETLSVRSGSREMQLQTIRDAGFTGVQFATPATKNELSLCHALRLGYAGSGRINTPADVFALAEELAANGYECATLHVGWGLEDDENAHRLIESILETSAGTNFPLYVETHRATIFQDMWRTVQFVRRYPDLRFNGDFSHWYAGQEMVYGTFERKFAFIQPILERVRFIHGRVASPGCMQVPVQEGTSYLEHFKQLWTACFRHFLANAKPDDFICFAPELLSSEIFYARTFHGTEESSRWEESLLLTGIAEQCFNQAKI